MTPHDSKCLIILGMHRSHTSFLAQTLAHAGLHLGHDLIPANYYNAKGYYESQQIVDFHEHILHKYNLKNRWTGINTRNLSKLQWDSEDRTRAEDLASIMADNNPVWGWKDPRTCLFLEQWKSIIPDCKAIIIFRPATACINSLIKKQQRGKTAHWRVDLIPRYYAQYHTYNTALWRFYKQYKEDCFIINGTSDITDPDVSNQLNTQLKNWEIPLSPIDLSTHFDPALVTSAQAPIVLQAITKLLAYLYPIKTW